MLTLLHQPSVGAWVVPIFRVQGAEDSFKRLDELLKAREK